MALVKFGGNTADMRGSVGGTTYSRNRAGAYARQKVTPINPVTGALSSTRAIFSALSKAWATILTPTQRVGWIAFAATHTFTNIFGDSITLSGIAMYQAVNNRILQVGKTRIDDAPATWSAPAVTSFNTLQITETAHIIDHFVTNATYAGDLPGNYTLYTFATPVIPGGRLVQNNNFRLVNVTPYAQIATATELAATYLARFPLLTVNVGDVIWVKQAVLDWDTGAIGVPFTGQAIVTETV